MKRPMRLIVDVARRATSNMAIDEILMLSQNAGGSLPTLRFYLWDHPTYSLGYFQNVEEVKRRFHCLEKDIHVVRRITGGGMVLHGEDLTFSLCLADPNKFFSADLKESYLKVNEALLAGLKPIDPDLDYADCKTVPSGRGNRESICFEKLSCYDLLLRGKKVVGASQRRQGRSILHQSTIFFDQDKKSLVNQIMKGFEAKWDVYFEEIPLREEELKRADEKENERFGSAEWAFPVRNTAVFHGVK